MIQRSNSTSSSSTMSSRSSSTSASQQKRKQQAGSNVAPAAVVRVERVEESSPSHNPIVCSFPGCLPEALLPSSTTATTKAAATATATAEPPTFHWYGNRLVGRDNACFYASSAAANDESNKKLATQLCVGVYDKVTGQLTLHPTAGEGRVFALQQRVKNYQSSISNNHGSSSDALLKGAAAQYEALFRDFGSAKKRKVIKSKQANRVADAVGEGVTGTQMSESNRRAVAAQKAAAAAADSMNADRNPRSDGLAHLPPAPSDGVDEAMEAMRRRFLPQHDMAAEFPAQVYNARNMAGTAAWNRCHDEVKACWLKAMRDGDGGSGDGDVVSSLLAYDEERLHRDPWFGSIKEVLQKIPNSRRPLVSDDGRIEEYIRDKLHCAYLLNNWMSLYRKLRHRRFIEPPDETRNRFFGVPVAIGLQFLERFATPTLRPGSGQAGYVMSQANSDSCVVHMLILYMMSEYNKDATALKCSNLQPLVDDLCMDAADAAKLLRQAGCNVTVQRKNDRTVVEAFLKTPLTFPKAGNRRGVTRK